MGYSITLTRSDNSAQCRFYAAECPRFSLFGNNKKFKYEIPDDETGEGALSINLGFDKGFRFPFKLVDTTADTDSMSVSGSIYTIQQKMEYLMDTFLSGKTDVFYTLSIVSVHGTFSNTYKTQLVDFSIDIDGNSPNSVTGNISLSLGGGNQ